MDHKDILKFNLQKKDFVYSQNEKLKSDIKHGRKTSKSLWDPEEKPRYRSAKRRHETTSFNSQIIFGEEKNTHLKSHNRITYSGLGIDKENAGNIQNIQVKSQKNKEDGM